MRVALLTTNLARGGAETQVAQLARALGAGDARIVSLLAPSAFTDTGVRVSSLGMKPGTPDPMGVARLARLLRSERPDILHAHMFHANVMARLVRLVLPAPVVISTIHSAAETKGGDPRWRDRVYRATDALADATVCVSQAVAERHLSAGAVSRARLRVIPNGVDTRRFRPADAAERARLREALGIGGAFTWLAVGRLMWKKDPAALLRAMAKQPAGELLLAGEGPMEAELRALAAKLGVRARFLGLRDDIDALMRASDALALSSVVEGMPVALLEAAACGLPAVATDVGGVREAVLDGRTGYVVPPGDEEALAAAMSRVAGMPAEARRAMSEAAREHAAANFDMNAVAARWRETYEELLGAARAAAWM